LKSGLVNMIGVETGVAPPVPGQLWGWYETPSKSTSVPMQPPIGTSSESSALKQGASSSSEPAGSLTLPWLRRPRWAPMAQYSKCPISSAPPQPTPQGQHDPSPESP
jgi:hypothetical protein